METIKSLEGKVETLQCEVVCEKEQNTTLGIEQSTVMAELQKAKSENVKLLEELSKVVEDSQSKVRELLTLTCKHFNNNVQSERDQLLVTQLQNEITFSSNQYSTLNTQYTLLQEESRHEKQRLDSITTELAEMTRRVSTMTTDVSATRESKESLQKQLKIVHDQLDLANTALSQNASLYFLLC